MLIVVGSSVRASGAGLGCPDWPTCFGMLIPPTSESQLPADYQQIYADRGYADTRFNAVKTWTEFGNRLTSVFVGLLMLLCALYAWFRLRITSVSILLFGVLAVTGFQSWLGSVVIASHLLPIVVSTHMIFALVIVGLLHSAYVCSQPGIQQKTTFPMRWMYIPAIALLLQIGVGLQVREGVDTAVSIALPRAEWLAHSIDTLYLHIFTAVILVLLSTICIAKLWFSPAMSHLRILLVIWGSALTSSLLLGFIMLLGNVPAFAQPLHLLAAAVQVGVFWHLLLMHLRNRAAPANA